MKEILKTFALDSTSKLQEVGADNNLTENIKNIITAIIGILGIVCVVVMIMGGVSYMTSAGDAGKVKKAKDTILYGLIGLIVCALAFALANFIITSVIGEA